MARHLVFPGIPWGMGVRQHDFRASDATQPRLAGACWAQDTALQNRAESRGLSGELTGTEWESLPAAGQSPLTCQELQTMGFDSSTHYPS